VRAFPATAAVAAVAAPGAVAGPRGRRSDGRVGDVDRRVQDEQAAALGVAAGGAVAPETAVVVGAHAAVTAVAPRAGRRDAPFNGRRGEGQGAVGGEQAAALGAAAGPGRAAGVAAAVGVPAAVAAVAAPAAERPAGLDRRMVQLDQAATGEQAAAP